MSRWAPPRLSTKDAGAVLLGFTLFLVTLVMWSFAWNGDDE